MVHRGRGCECGEPKSDDRKFMLEQAAETDCGETGLEPNTQS